MGRASSLVLVLVSSLAWGQEFEAPQTPETREPAALAPPPLVNVEDAPPVLDPERALGACLDGDADACEIAASAAEQDGRTAYAAHLRERADMARRERLEALDGQQPQVTAPVRARPPSAASRRRLLDDDDWARPVARTGGPTPGVWVGAAVAGLAASAALGAVGVIAGFFGGLLTGGYLGAVIGVPVGAIIGAGAGAAWTVDALLKPTDTRGRGASSMLGGIGGALLGGVVALVLGSAFPQQLTHAEFLVLLVVPIPVLATAGALLQAAMSQSGGVSAAFVPERGGGRFVLSTRF